MTTKKGISAHIIDGPLEGMSMKFDRGALATGYVDTPLTRAALMGDTKKSNTQIRYYIYETGLREFVLSVKKVYP